MFLRKNYSKQTGRTHLSIVQGYRGSDGKTKHKTVQKVGYLDELIKELRATAQTGRITVMLSSARYITN